MLASRGDVESKRSVIVAAIANLAIAIFKFVAAAIGGSASMLSEGFHSIVDTIDQLFLLLGLHRAEKPPTHQHPFGHGLELYFWTTVVALVIFGVGGGVSFYEGLLHVVHGEELKPPLWSYIALGFAAVCEGTSLVVGYRSLRKRRPEGSLWSAFRASKDPSVLTVVFEDTAALAGIALAFCGVFFSHLFHRPWIDGAAAMCIGALLMVVAVLLGRESKSLVTGEAADPELVERLRCALASDPDVEDVGGLLTMYFGPRSILLNVELEFRGELSADELDQAIDRVEERVRAACPEVGRIFIEMETLSRKRRTISRGHPQPA